MEYLSIVFVNDLFIYLVTVRENASIVLSIFISHEPLHFANLILIKLLLYLPEYFL